MSSEGIAIDKASQDCLEPTGEVHVDLSLEGMATVKASQDDPRATKEVHGDVSSKGTPTDKASQDSLKPTEGNKEVQVDVSPEGTAVVADEEGSSIGPETDEYLWTTLFGDLLRPMVEKKTEDFKVKPTKPTTVVNEEYRRLFFAAVRGYWIPVERELRGNFNLITAKVVTVQDESYSMLDIAVMFARDELVEELVKHLPGESDVDILRKALFNAARTGRIRIVRALHRAIEDKVHAESETIERALHRATQYAPKQKEVISYLAKCTTSAPTCDTMRYLIMAGHLDVALSLAERFKTSTSSSFKTSTSSKETENLILLGELAKMKSHFGGGTKLKFWEECIYKCIRFCLVDTSNDDFKDKYMAQAIKKFKKSLWDLATKRAPRIKSYGESDLRRRGSFHFAIGALFTMECDMDTPKIVESLLTSGIVLNAASRGILEIVSLCLHLYPELMWEKNFTKKLMEEIVNGRHVELFRLVNAFETIQYLTDDTSMRHLMETLVESQLGCVPTDVYGAAFLLQRELQWFKVLEDRSNPSLKSLEFEVLKDTSVPPSKSLKLVEAKERRGKTFWEIFVEERHGLLKEAGQWMKDTSSSCSLVATLIITVAFTAAFTVPGGNDSSTGIPIFLKKGSFMVFAIADALALFSSVTATLMFLAILTSSYAIEDFLRSLPRKMILGLTFLCLSLAFMLVAFSSALTIVLSEQSKWIYVPIILLVAFPVALFTILQLPMYVDMVKCTYQPRLYSPLKM